MADLVPPEDGAKERSECKKCGRPINLCYHGPTSNHTIEAVHGRSHDGIPEDGIIVTEFEITGYVRPDDGELMYSVWTDGEASMSSTLGLLRMAEHDILVERDKMEDED